MKNFLLILPICFSYAVSAVIVSEPVMPKLSKPVNELPKAIFKKTSGEVRIVPRNAPKSKVPISKIHEKKVIDAALQIKRTKNNVSGSLNFEGISDSNVMPPDTVGDVGPNHYVQMINSGGGADFAIYNKFFIYIQCGKCFS